VEVVPPALPTPVGARVRVVTFNMERGADVAGLVAAIQGDPDLATADVILAQELESYHDEDGSRASQIARGLGWGYVYAPAREEFPGSHGLAAFSPHTLDSPRVMVLPFADLRARSVPRIALGVDLVTPNGTLHLITVHLDTRMNIGERILQLRPVVLDAPAGTVVAGDMNMNPWIWAGAIVPLPTIDAAADTDQGPLLDDYLRTIGYATPTDDVGATQHIPGLELRLDAIYTRGVEAMGEPVVERGVTASDHWPMWIDLALQPAL
jgi:endonuclease/exonuclease/phosphatase family metal-dependent hydrolase